MTNLLVKYRWRAMSLVGFIFVIIEIVDHNRPQKPFYSDLDFWIEALILGIVLPILGGFLLGLMKQVESERTQMQHELDHQNRLSQSLVNASRWEELLERIIQFPSSILPVVSAYLSIYDPEQARFELATASGNNQNPPPNLSIENLHGPCILCASPTTIALRSLSPCPTLSGENLPNGIARYCLPLSQGDSLVALLHFDIPDHPTITSQQARTLASIGPEIALAIRNAQLELSISAQEANSSSERQRIARDLHDTLGQNISLLRLKLDQLSSQNALLGIAAVRMELERMRDLADEAYHQVRGTLADLKFGDQPDLSTAIRELSDPLTARTKLHVRVNCQGNPVPLTHDMLRQVLFICREALNNIEKHAQANQVDIKVNWEEEGLQIQINDDGRGFVPDEVQTKDHFGLRIMHDRAQEIHGCLTLNSVVNTGTHVSLWVPLSKF